MVAPSPVNSVPASARLATSAGPGPAAAAPREAVDPVPDRVGHHAARVERARVERECRDGAAGAAPQRVPIDAVPRGEPLARGRARARKVAARDEPAAVDEERVDARGV